MSENENLIKSKNIGLIIFARMSSKRFPGKVLKKIYKNKSSIQLIVNNLIKANFGQNLIVATSKLRSDKKIIEFCKSENIKFFKGSNQNVFLRTKECIKKFKLKYIVRICADRPFFDPKLMTKMIEMMLKKNFDIITNANPRTYPKGLTCEVAKSKIFNVNNKKLSKTDREHIFNYFYRKKKYKIYNFKSKFNKNFINKNFCLDTKKDLRKIKNIILKFSRNGKIINSQTLYKFH